MDGRSPLAALGAEVGVEDCLSKKALIERMIAVLLPEESLDSSAAVQRHAWRLLRSCLGRQAAGEQIDADFLSTEVVDADLRLKLLAWCLCIPTTVDRDYRDYRLGSEVQCNRIYINRFGNNVIIVS